MNVATIAKPKLSIDAKKLLQIFFFGFLAWFLLKPAALSDKGWTLLVVFVSTIVAIVAKPLPMGAVALTSCAILCATKTLALQTVLEGFAYDQIWLIVFACFLARGFIKTGLGKRIAYGFIALFGGTPSGMGYGLVVSSALMAPLIPSVTARTGGIILPVLRSIVDVVGIQAGPYLTLIVFHASALTSAMFITANASNPIIVKFAQNMGIDISWMTWAKAAFLPGLVSLLALPFLMRFFAPLKVANPQAVQQHARDELAQMGSISWNEKVLIMVFSLLLTLWAFGRFFSVHATEAALFGVGILLICKVLTFKDLLHEELAWDTFLWMGILIMMASQLQNMGVIGWLTDQVVQYVPQLAWHWQLLFLAGIYFYSHYFFASVAAHVSSMYGPFLAIAVAAGAPPLISALFLGFLSSLFGALTHYASGPAPILYAEQHVDIKTWWKVGLLTSIFYIAVWVLLGSFWWQILGLL